MRTIGVFCKPHPAVRAGLVNSFIDWMEQRGLRVVVDDESAPLLGKKQGCTAAAVSAQSGLIIIFGGDGTLLRVVRLTQPFAVPILAVNLGSLGFLTEFSLDGLQDAMTRILGGGYLTEQRMMLRAELWRGEAKIADLCALNEVVIDRGAHAKIVDLEVYVDGQHMTSYRADGLIVATPTGSTAYSLSAGGPIIHPCMHALVLAPICPFALTNRAIVIPDQSAIQVKPTHEDKQVRVTLDGQESVDMEGRDILRIKKAESSILLVQAPGKNFYQILREKLHWGAKVKP